MRYILWIAIGGGLGAVFRYSSSKFIMQLLNTTFPAGTLFVNIVGSFILGAFYVFINRFTVSGEIVSLFTIGMLGAFTTMSSYSLETVNLFRDGEYKYMLLNILANNLMTITAIVIGIYLTQLFLKNIK